MSDSILSSTSSANDPGPVNREFGLFLISFVGLFLELLLIRWVTTEINIFAYLQNTILVVCFMGFGMGCMTSRQPIDLRRPLFSLLLLVLLMAIPYSREALGKISLMFSVLDDFVVWHMALSEHPLETVFNVSVGLAVTFFLMLIVWGIFIPVGRILGRLMDSHPNPIGAYSINIAGSLIGIWAFTLLSVYYQPPFVWFVVVAASLVPFLAKRGKESLFNGLALSAMIVLAWFAGRDPSAKDFFWSPYQKLVLRPIAGEGTPENYTVSVNNTFYLLMTKYDESIIKSRPDLYPPKMIGLSQYDIPPLLHSDPQKVLIVGSGGGNDVAGALRRGVRDITAVEIDPAIIELGRKFHGDKPYASPHVKVINDDARSFFATTEERYDLISFGLLDSHTTTSMTNARLDHYVYTEEALRKVKKLLRDDGIITLAFEAFKPFIADRIATMLLRVFEQEPFSFRIPGSGYGPGGRIFVVGNLDMVRRQLAANQYLSTLISDLQTQFPAEFTYTTPVTTDDWPYLYLPSRKIPTLFYLLGVLILGLYGYTQWRFDLGSVVGKWKMPHWHFFFLGAGFLLLEVQNISKAAVVLGNTWWVNSVIISGILLMVLAANLTAFKFPRAPLPLFYVGLIGSCIALYFVDLSVFAFLPYFQKASVVALLAGTPIFFSGVIFIRSFAVVPDRDVALGANLIGAMIGGLLQSLTFVTGIKALLLIVALLYATAMWTRPRTTPPPSV
jgi:hypothetical protein